LIKVADENDLTPFSGYALQKQENIK